MSAWMIMLLGLGAGVLVGTMGIAGGIVIVPVLVHVMGMDQHVAQGTSTFLLLPPLGLGALSVYWKRRQVDLRAGLICAFGVMLGAYFGGVIAVATPSPLLRLFFGIFLMFAATLVWRQTKPETAAGESHD
ncbi:MAG: sulfite exporter TauE/SafE family protein [Candidatus Acidiferrales bacterium]